MPKIVHHRDKCIGCGSCALEQPEHWEMEEKDGKANLKDSSNKSGKHIKNVRKDEEELCKKVVEDCPVNCIKYEEQSNIL